MSTENTFMTGVRLAPYPPGYSDTAAAVLQCAPYKLLPCHVPPQLVFSVLPQFSSFFPCSFAMIFKQIICQNSNIPFFTTFPTFISVQSVQTFPLLCSFCPTFVCAFFSFPQRRKLRHPDSPHRCKKDRCKLFCSSFAPPAKLLCALTVICYSAQ